MMMTTDFDAVRDGVNRVRIANASSSVADDGPSDDALLIQRLRDGDAAAGDILVSRYSVQLMRYLRRLGGSDHIAEELFQQTWLSVLNHLDRFHAGAVAAAGGATVASSPNDPPSDNGSDEQVNSAAVTANSSNPVGSRGFKAWLFRIATNKANDAWRLRTRESAATVGLGHMYDGDVAPHAGQSLEQAEQEAKLKRAIDQLPENQRQVLLLRFYSGLKFIEIADVLGCPLNTALGRLHKAILKLRVLMQ